MNRKKENPLLEFLKGPNFDPAVMKERRTDFHARYFTDPYKYLDSQTTSMVMMTKLHGLVKFPLNQLPSEAIEKRVDQWIKNFLFPKAPTPPPSADLLPWVAVRAYVGGMMVEMWKDQNRPVPGSTFEAGMIEFLITQWYALGQHYWRDADPKAFEGSILNEPLPNGFK